MSASLRTVLLSLFVGLLVKPASADLLTPEEARWVRECLERLDSNAPRVRKSAEGALVAMGRPILPAVVNNLKRVKGRAAQAGLLRVLLALGRSAVLQDLTKMAGDASGTERKRIEELMARLGDALGPGEPLTLEMSGAALAAWSSVPAGMEHELSGWPTALLRGSGTVEAGADGVRLVPAGGEAHTVRREQPRAISLEVGGQPMPVLVYRKLDRWYAASASLRRGSIRNLTLELWDTDLDGRFDGSRDMARVVPGAWQLLGPERELFHVDRVIQLTFAAEGTVKLSVQAQPDVVDPEHLEFLHELHAWRAQHGLGPLHYDVARSRACTEHSRYLAQNDGKQGVTDGGSSHGQDPNLPGATAKGAEAGANSVLRSSGLSGTLRAIAATMLHRVAWLAPTGSKIGIGAAREGRAAWCTIWTERGSAETDARLVTVPAPGAAGVPTDGGDEWPPPDQPPGWYGARRGYPISVTYDHLGLRRPRLSLLRRSPSGADGIPVPARTWSPEAPIAKTHGRNRGTIFLMAAAPLERDASYWAVFEADGPRGQVRFVWTFSTGR